MPVSGFLVACALHEEAGGPRGDEPRLVLSEKELRTLYERVAELDLVGKMLFDELPGILRRRAGGDRRQGLHGREPIL